MTTAEKRFMNFVDATPSGCWEWTGYRSHDGYGQFTLFGKGWRAHRASHVLFIGEIPDGYFVLHSCDNPPCVNPAHLRAGTPKENVQDMVERGRAGKHMRQKCPKGHVYDKMRGNSRACYVCDREALRKNQGTPEFKAWKQNYDAERWKKRVAKVKQREEA